MGERFVNNCYSKKESALISIALRFFKSDKISKITPTGCKRYNFLVFKN
jgi:hypothetical protein